MSIKYAEFSLQVHGIAVETHDELDELMEQIRADVRKRLNESPIDFRDDEGDVEIELEEYAGEAR